VAEVEFASVWKRFGGVAAVAGISVPVERGEFVALLGPSGCGKTTTLRLIAGLLQPDEGEIFIRGRPVAGVPPNKRDVGIVFQNYALFPHMTVAGNVAFGLQMRGVSGRDVRKQVGEALELVQLGSLEARYPHQLSGGQQQRVALARALVFRPAVLLLDEPLAALDKRLRLDMQVELKTLQRQVGITTIFVTHDQEEALTLSDRIAVMNAGRIEQLGTPEDIYERPATAFVLEFIGRANMFPGEIGTQDGRPVLRAGALTLAVPDAGARDGRAILAIRPERVRLCAAPPAGEANVVSAQVTNVVYLGSHAHYYVRLATGEELVAFQSVAEGPAVNVDAPVWVTWRTEDVRIVPA
jgi:spermidine/putrescine ABC transporter ATP-binding subunit